MSYLDDHCDMCVCVAHICLPFRNSAFTTSLPDNCHVEAESYDAM